jgi:hypothetical protein
MALKGAFITAAVLLVNALVAAQSVAPTNVTNWAIFKGL